MKIVHPGQVLWATMKGLPINASELARRMDVPPNRILAILKGSRAISAESALRLESALGVPAWFWQNLQIAHDLSVWKPTAKKST